MGARSTIPIGDVPPLSTLVVYIVYALELGTDPQEEPEFPFRVEPPGR